MENQFFYPMTTQSGAGITRSVVTEFQGTLGLSLGTSDRMALVNTNGKGSQVQGLYWWSGTRWVYAMPYITLCEGIIGNAEVTVAYELTGPVDFSDPNYNVQVYRNGLLVSGTVANGEFHDVWGVIKFPAGGGTGTVTTVNNVGPDGNGNVAIGISNIPGLVAALAAAGQVKTVNGAQPDTNGNVTVPVATTVSAGTVKVGSGLTVTSDGTVSAQVYTLPAATPTVLGGVKQGSGVNIAADGTLSVTGYTLPVATTTVLGGVKQGAGVTIAGDGTLSAAVLSVNGRSGAIVLTSTDVGIPTDLLSGAGGTLGSAYVPAYLLGAVNYQGTWNATTNSPTIASGSASSTNKGYYYVVTVAGTTTVDGISTWNVGDWIISNGVNWSRVPVNQTVISVSGQTGAVVIQASDNNTATGHTLIANSGATTGNIKLLRLVAGTGVTIGTDASGNLLVSSSISQGVTQVTTEGTGVSLIGNDGTTGGIAILKSLAAGSNITITPDAQNQTLTITANQVLQAATTTTLGGVIVGAGLGVIANGTISLAAPSGVNLGGVKAGSNVTIGSDGTISVAAPYSLPAATTSTLGGVIIGTGITVNSGTISVTPYTLPQATASTLGGVTVPTTSGLTVTTGALGLTPATASQIGGVKIGSGITVAGDGTISVSSSSSGVTQVESVGTGTSLINNDGTTGGIAMVKSLAAGSNVTITQDAGTQTLTITANQTITPATTSALGGIIVGAGLSVTGGGTLSLAAPSGANLGGVKAGTNITIASDGTISASGSGGGAVSSVNGQTGIVVIQAVDNNDASGISLIADAGATTGTIKLKNLVAGTGMTLSADGNGNLLLNSSGGYTLPAATGSTLGGVIVGTGLSVDGSGNLTNTGVTSLTFNASAQTGGITMLAGNGIQFVTADNQNTIEVVAGTLLDAPVDGNEYVRQNAEWVAIPDLSNSITSVTSDTTSGSHSILEGAPPANSVITKSISAGTNVVITDNGSNLIISAAVPGVVASVNGVNPDGSGNVVLTASNVNAVPIAGNVTMTGPLNMGTQVLNGIPNPVNPTDAVNYQTLTGMSIDGGVIG